VLEIKEIVNQYLGYLYVILGLFWVGIIFAGGALLLLWPSLTSIASGGLLVLRPEKKLSSALAKASAIYAILLAGYQAYVSVALLGSVFSTIAAYSLASFAAIAILYTVLLYAAISRAGAPAEKP